MGQYGVTHFLWGSFEPPPYYEINPERWALDLEQLRTAIGLTDAREDLPHRARPVLSAPPVSRSINDDRVIA